jgi:hypothetical protein
MKIKEIDYYVKKLSEVFPELEESSIKEIIKMGNLFMFNKLKLKKTTLNFTGKSRVDGTYNTFLMYKHNSVMYNNKAKRKKRLKAKRELRKDKKDKKDAR